MFSKVVMLAAALAAVCAQEHGHGHHGHVHAVSSQHYIQHDLPVHKEEHHEHIPHIEHHHHVEHHHHPKYEYSYDVKDPHTHDMKSQREHRDGDVVKGEYSLHQPDGVVRHVKYHSDHKGGFRADVHYSAPSHHVHHVQH